MAWLSNQFEKRIDFDIDATYVPSDRTDITLALLLDQFSATSLFTDAQSNGEDIRVTLSDGTTELPVEVVRFIPGSSTGLIYFRYDGVLSSTVDTTLYLYWGNPYTSAPAPSSTYGSQNTWKSDYVGVYHFNDSSYNVNDTVADSTSNGNDGAVKGSSFTTSTASPLGGGLEFANNDEYIQLVNFGSTLAQDITITAYVYDVQYSKGIVVGNPFSGGKVYFLASYGGWNSSFRGLSHYTTANNWFYGGGATSFYNTSTWRHMGWKKSGSNVRYIANGTLDDSSTSSVTMGASGATEIGRYANDNIYHWGTIDAVKISTALDDDEIFTQEEAVSNSSFYILGMEETNSNFGPPAASFTSQILNLI